jgi:hypothetical protein
MKKLENFLERVTGREVDLTSTDGVSPNYLLLVLGLLIMLVYAIS